MSHPEPAIAGFYDHERDQRPEGRDRPAPDWGGDELFTSTPRRRRFDRLQHGHPLDRPERSRRRETTEHPTQRPAARVASIQARIAEHDAEPPAAGEAEAVQVGFEPAGSAPEAVLPAVAEPSEAVAIVEHPAAEHPVVRAAAGPDGRRTVTVTGHPDRYGARRRPPVALDQRVIANPERIAAYAFALGLLLIVIAFLTANA